MNCPKCDAEEMYINRNIDNINFDNFQTIDLMAICLKCGEELNIMYAIQSIVIDEMPKQKEFKANA